MLLAIRPLDPNSPQRRLPSGVVSANSGAEARRQRFHLLCYRSCGAEKTLLEDGRVNESYWKDMA